MKEVRNGSEGINIGVVGTVHIEDDLGNTLLDKQNAIHPRNMARIIARGLANEPNGYVYRIALGNGGTLTDASLNVTFNTPNDGVPPDVVDWRSRLYNETYSEVVDDASTLLGVDPGSSDQSGTRTGGGSSPSGDSGTGVISNDLGNTSEVVITAIINKDEPNNQTAGASVTTDGAFAFDELGLYSGGASASDSAGYVNIRIDNMDIDADTDTQFVWQDDDTYEFDYSVNGSTFNTSFKIPDNHAGPVTYGQLVNALNTADSAWSVSPPLNGAQFRVTDDANGVQTYGFLQFISTSVGNASAVTIGPPTSGAGNVDFIASLANNVNNNINTILTPVPGKDAGVENKPGDATAEGERLLTHLIFQPIYKSSDRQITITYTLTISVGRTS